MDPSTEALSSKESLSQEVIPGKAEAKLQKINAKIADLEKKLLSCSSSIEKIHASPPRERRLAVEKARQLHEMPPEAATEEATIKFLSEAVEKAQKELHELQSKKAALGLPSTKKPQKPFGLSDKEIVDLSGPLGEQYSKLVEERNTIGIILQRLYFETQAGPTRRTLGKPGDIAVVLRSLDGSSRGLMFVNFYKNIKAFYDHLPEEDKLKNGPLFVTLFEKLEKARPLFLQPGSLESTLDQVRALKAGESIILPGGLLFHAVLYEIKKEGDGTCSFTIFNSAEGLEYHKAVGRKYCNARIRNIDPTKLNELFFKNLASCLKIEPLYSLLQSLGALEYDESAHYDQGFIGSCSYECLLRWLKDQMGKELYHELRHFTVQALLDDCALHFGGQVRDDASVREIKVKGRKIQEADISKLRKYGERCIQKIGRNIQIDKAIETATAIPDKALQTQYLLSFVEKKEIRETILDDVDRCLVLLKISNTLISRGPAFLETAKTIRDQAIKEAGAFREPEKRATAYNEIAYSLFIQKNSSEALPLIKQASHDAKRISNPEKRLEACSEIADTCFMLGNNPDAMELIREAMAAAKELSDPEQGAVAFIKLGKIIAKNTVQLFAKGSKSDANELVDLAVEIALQHISDDELKLMAFTEIIKILASQEDFSKIEKMDPKYQLNGYFSFASTLAAEAKTLFLQGKKSEANQLADQAIKIATTHFPDTHYMKSLLFYQIAELLFSHGDKKAAIDILNQTVEFAKTITDRESRSYKLEMFSEKFLSEGCIDEARKAAELIPNEDIKKPLLQKIAEKSHEKIS